MQVFVGRYFALQLGCARIHADDAATARIREVNQLAL
jgi:hypothetical protein